MYLSACHSVKKLTERVKLRTYVLNTDEKNVNISERNMLSLKANWDFSIHRIRRGFKTLKGNS